MRTQITYESGYCATGKKQFFEELSRQWEPITKLPCVIFEDRDDLNLWIERRHLRSLGGIGQTQWGAEEQARHGNYKYQIALHFLDYAQREGLISVEERKNRITTVQQYLRVPEMQKAMGIDASDVDNIKRTKTKEDFTIVSRKFITDLIADEPKIHSRQKKPDILAYASELSATPGQSKQSIEPISIMPRSGNQATPTPTPTSPPRTRQTGGIKSSTNIQRYLRILGNHKLRSLYNSLCKVSLRQHTQLLAVGVWVFFETLTSRAGRNPDTSFEAFLSRDRLRKYEFPKDEINTLQDVIKRIHRSGNITKHHSISTHLNAGQLLNDMETLEDLIVNIIKEAIENIDNR